jgi:predicted polyphosphate/ATP-dependent NAD kinase
MKALGVIVNPIAGMGGAVALKGTDGAEILRRARDLGAVARAPTKARRALGQLTHLRAEVGLVTCGGSMGEIEAREEGFEPRVLDIGGGAETTGADTRRAAEAMVAAGVDLILFAGGDGTARDLCEAIGSHFPVLGVPAGVKLHSAASAATPERAGELAGRFLQGERFDRRQAEVMDIDEDAFRAGSVQARLYGYLEVPYEPRCLQSKKCGSRTDAAELHGVVRQTVSEMSPDVLYLVGSGTTTQAVLEALGSAARCSAWTPSRTALWWVRTCRNRRS